MKNLIGISTVFIALLDLNVLWAQNDTSVTIESLMSQADQGDFWSRLANAQALAQMGSIYGEIKLENWLLASDSQQGVREQAAMALGVVKTKNSARALAHALANDPVSNVRSWAAQSLGNLPADEASVSVLMNAFHGDKSLFVRSKAAESLGKLQVEGVAPELLQILSLSESAYYSRTDDTSFSQVWNGAARGLTAMKEKKAIPYLLAKLDSDTGGDKYNSVRTAIQMLGEFRATEALDKLQVLAKNDDESIRRDAEEAIEKIQSDKQRLEADIQAVNAEEMKIKIEEMKQTLGKLERDLIALQASLEGIENRFAPQNNNDVKGGETENFFKE